MCTDLEFDELPEKLYDAPVNSPIPIPSGRPHFEHLLVFVLVPFGMLSRTLIVVAIVDHHSTKHRHHHRHHHHHSTKHPHHHRDYRHHHPRSSISK